MGKLIWVCGIPFSGKSTIAKRLYRELEWAGKKVVLLDDEQIKRVRSGKDIQKVLDTIGQEYNILVVPSLKILPRKPDLVIWCNPPLKECVKRDRARRIGEEIAAEDSFAYVWKGYSVDADVILIEDNSWEKLQEAVETKFGEINWQTRLDV
ncbi:MAG TPA: adenylyl-sulfate kinase [candidate division CPR3 bacterium]|uniref:Adenylyl-sulfate kinase n=1 Tax=candidate division CPR3 bacterium TaxID=2268181 RepID=A0A7C1P5A9_UNCC3|nr:adenylyl-sulfate kinase [candidate division CPR3 bacterium]